MKISVIVPIYNCAEFLPACLDSILGQTFRNLEVILINDGSSDASPQICEYYAELDERIHVIHQKNQGVSNARNQGLKHATGELISFIDSDDTLDSDMYELLVRFMNENDADISHCGYKHIVGEEVRLVHDTKRVVIQDQEQSLKCLVGSQMFVGSLWNKLYRKELLTGINFRESLKINEDILFNFEAFKKARKSVFADYAKYNYIAHKNSSACFVTPNEKKLSDACAVNKNIYEQLKTSELKDIAAERYLRSLSGYYRFCVDSKSDKCAQIATIIQSVSQNTERMGKNMRITVLLIRFCPWLYRIIYSIYDKVRKSNWEV